MENVKLSYILKIVFSFVDGKQKLKSVKRNKSFQKKIDISIINYIHFKGRYIIYESNGKGKEYDWYKGRLKFEGEYLNGERNGKVKEYWDDGELKFEGEYLNGKKNGKRKVYDFDDRLKFEGEYLNDKRNGKGKECWDGKLRFEG